MEINIMANKILEVVQAISNAVHNKHHGSGVDFGLRRDKEGELVVLDGFGVKFSGKNMIVTYNSEEKFENAHNSKFEEKIDDTIEEIVSNIKKQYKSYSSNGSLKLKQVGEVNVLVETVNRRTIKVTAHKVYEIGNLSEIEGQEESVLSKEAEKAQKDFNKANKLEESIKKFLDMDVFRKLNG